jgi:hypothetical protein
MSLSSASVKPSMQDGIDKLPPRSTAPAYNQREYAITTPLPDSLCSICGRWLRGTPAGQPPARGGLREGGVDSNLQQPLVHARLPLHSLSQAGLPKYDLSTDAAREADKCPLRMKFGANSIPLATHTSRSPHQSRQSHVLLQTEGRDGDFHRGATGCVYVDEVTFGPFLAQQQQCLVVLVGYSRWSDNALNARLRRLPSSSAQPSTHDLELLISLSLMPSLP